jgi:hypothetical protein
MERNGSRGRRTLVVFLRHFWCPLCQDYMVALARGVGAAVAGSTHNSSSPCDGEKNTNNDNDNSTTPASAPGNVHFTNSMPMPTSATSATEAAMPTSLSDLFAVPHSSPAPTCSDPTSTPAAAPAKSNNAETQEARHGGGEGEGDAEACPACTASGSVTFAYLESLVSAGSGAGAGSSHTEVCPVVLFFSSPSTVLCPC